jgi:hypothetical protein
MPWRKPGPAVTQGSVDRYPGPRVRPESRAPAPVPGARTNDPAHPLHELQRQAGNRAVAGLIGAAAVQREYTPPPTPQPSESGEPKLGDIRVRLPTPAPRKFSTDELAALDPSYQAPARPGVAPAGETPPTNPPNVMALHDPSQPSPASVQRDPPSGGGTSPAPSGGADPSPHLGVDLQATYPLALSASLVLRDYNLKTLPNVMRGLDILHEPSVQFSLSIAPNIPMSVQLGKSLLNLHMPSLFGTEVETALTAQLAADPAAGASFGPGVQAEQHIWKMISVTMSLNAVWTVPFDGSATTFAFSPGAGLLIHVP